MSNNINVPKEFKEYEALVHSIARGYPENSRCDYEDYLNVGFAALFEAEKSYNPELGNKFSTYAFPFIKNAIEKEFQENANALSGCTPYIINNIEGERKHISFLNNSLVSISETKKSLDDRFQQEGWNFLPSTPLKEVIVESGVTDPAQNAEIREMRVKIAEIISTLEPEEQDILYRRVFEGDSFQAIADAKQLTWRAVNYRFFKSLEKLKDRFEKAGIDVYA